MEMIPLIESRGKATAWWSKEVAEAVEEYRKKLRTKRTIEQLTRTRRKRNRAVYLAKTEHFRKMLQTATERPNQIWKLAKWGRTESNKAPALPVVPPLKIWRESRKQSGERSGEQFREQPGR